MIAFRRILVCSIFFLLPSLNPMNKAVRKSPQVLKVVKTSKVLSWLKPHRQIGVAPNGLLVIKQPTIPSIKIPNGFLWTNLGYIEAASLERSTDEYDLIEYSTPPSGCNIDIEKRKLFCVEIPEELPAPKTLDLSQFRFFSIVKELCEPEGSSILITGKTIKGLSDELIGPAGTDFYFLAPAGTTHPVQAHLWIKPFCA